MQGETAVPANGGGNASGKPDGVNAPDQRGRVAGGESGGGGSNADVASSQDGSNSGFLGHGGQSDIAYHGGGQAGEKGERAGNGVTGGGENDQKGAKPGPVAPYGDRIAEQTRQDTLDGRPVTIFEESGVAAAEASGMTGVEGERRVDGDAPGSG